MVLITGVYRCFCGRNGSYSFAHYFHYAYLSMKIFLFLFFFLPQIAFAYTCTELVQHCNGILQWYANIIAEQTAKGVSPDKIWSMPDIQCTLVTPPGEPPTSRAKYIEDDQIGWCSGEPLRCTYPQIKVGTEENGDDKCACPPNAPLSGQLNSSQCEMDLRDKHHIEGLCGGPPPGMAQGNMVEICVSDNNGRGGCLEGYKKHPEATAPGIGDFCIPDVKCPAGTTSQTIVGGRLAAEAKKLNVAGCEGDNCCIMADSPCAEGYLPNSGKQPTDEGYCYKDGNCPEGTTAHSGFMGNSNTSYYGNFPSPAYPEYQGFCNTTGCCMGCRSGFTKSNDFCVNKTGEDPPKLCGQGTVMGTYIDTTSSSFGSGAYHTAMDCACPLNSVTRSPNASKGVMVSGGMHIGGDPNATYQDAVCDYSKVPGNDLSQIPDIEDFFDGSRGACALTSAGAIDKEKCFKMDGAMKDWLANNVDCGAKQGLDCISPKIQDMMSRCKVVAGVVTCSNFSVGGDAAGTGQSRLPDWVVDNTDKFGFPLPSFDGFEDIDGTGTGSTHKTSTSSTSTTTTTTSTSSKDSKNPVKMFDEDKKPSTGGSTTGGLDYFNDAWNSPKNKELRSKFDEVTAAFQRQRLVEIKMTGGDKPCFELSKVQFYKEFDWHLDDVCLLEPPYVGVFDTLRDVNLLLSMLLPALIMLRQ